MSSISRAPSSASIRPSASAPIRSSSSASTRPPSSASARSTTSRTAISAGGGSSRRVGSNVSRPASRTTQRPSSRLTSRPITRQSSRLTSYLCELVTQTTGLTAENNQEEFVAAVDSISRTLDTNLRPANANDFLTIQLHLNGHAEKARINSHDVLATALAHVRTRLKVISEHDSDLDAEIQASCGDTIPCLHRLTTAIADLLYTKSYPIFGKYSLALSQPPAISTLHYAEEFIERVKNPNKPPPGLTWAEILAEEPFTGQHWEGVYGLPPGSVKRENGEDDTASDDSLLSLSLLDDDYGQLDDETSSSSARTWSEDDASSELRSRPTDADDAGYMQQWSKEIAAYSDRSEVEQMKARQYWRPEWRIDPEAVSRPFNVGSASTLGPAYRRLLDPGNLTQNRYINEHDAVREILMALQGRNNLLLTWTSSSEENIPAKFVPDVKAPSLLHLTPDALQSVLTSYSELATTVEHLRKFVSAMYVSTAKSLGALDSSRRGLATFSRRTPRTLEAFTEAIDVRVRCFDAWCAAEEERMSMAQFGVGSPYICSMMNLRSRIEDEFSDAFDLMLKILRDVVQRGTRSAERVQAIWTFPDLPKRTHSAALSTFLLNSLLRELQRSSIMGDSVSSKSLLALFKGSMAPLWKMLHRWLNEGMPVRDVALGAPTEGNQYLELDEEFFIEDNELVLLDPDFWKESFVLRDDQSQHSTFTSIAEFLVPIGHDVLAAGKAIGLLRTLGMPSSVEGDSNHWLEEWQTFDELVKEETDSGVNPHSRLLDFPKLVYDKLHPLCCRASQMLSQMLVEECDVWSHLEALEDLYLMRRGDIMSNFLDVLFARMDTNLPWTDFHFLNTAFTDVATGMGWIDPALVRFSYRSQKYSSSTRTVRVMDGLQIEYAVPFPLTYIWGPGALQSYCSLFVFVLQIRKAKSMVERILVRHAPPGMSRNSEEMKMFYVVRSKLSWFINVLLNHVCTNVLDTQIRAFHKAFKRVRSLDEMIDLHNEHLQILLNQCLLLSNTTALHQAITSILDTTLLFSDSFLAFAGDTAHDISRHTVKPIKHHRSRRLKRYNKNIIGFSQSLSAIPPSSDSESDSGEDDGDQDYSNVSSFSAQHASESYVDEDNFVVRLDKMSSELDALVRFVRRGVESLAAGSGEAASSFGIFAFALEDWDS
ncbi:Spc98 family-domain-containing protein [Irpex rosettiformis]|uniref:Spc98 family-domain-containing protein n=1 Tax=Irpex rosettiformis TaxID=378272 RepID=A0ACB8UE11_9APHY|nr:Spc98 family-domain-containing protein [Irpex rosettiformis]